MLNYNKKRFLIYGFGISGKSSFNYLKKKNCSIKIFDDNFKFKKNSKKYSISKNEIEKAKFDYIIISPGINSKKCSISTYLKKNHNKIINELDLFYQQYKLNKKITVTGTNGKSTTVKLIYDILKHSKKDVRFVGNIGKSLLNEKNISRKTIFVIEASSYQIDYSKIFKTDVAIILNISHDHLERHNSFKNYANIKFKLIKTQNSNGIAIINKNSKVMKRLLKENKINSKIINIDNKIDVEILSKIKNNLLKNSNNLMNLKFILKIIEIFKLNKNKSIYILNKYKNLPFRQQILFNNKNLFVMNDSKSTSFSSSLENLKSFENIYWIVGGLSKKGDKFTLQNKFSKNIKAYVYGKDRSIIVKKFKNKIKFKKFKNILDILKTIIIDTKKDRLKKNIIFSPAAASFDQFNNFEERGKYFNSSLKVTNFIKKINDKK